MTAGQIDRTASCVCGALAVECRGEPVSVSLCNCMDCQRRTGSAFGIAAFFDRQKLRIRGQSSRYTRRSDEGHEFRFFFCPRCGGTVYWETAKKAGIVAVAAGAFADADFPAPTQSVFEDHRHPWLRFTF